jgi:TnpA family transposase
MRCNGSQIIAVYYMKMSMAYSHLSSEMSIFITILINMKT